MFENLFKPLQVGSITLKNRFVMTPMSSKLTAAEHHVGERAAAYYAERAKGGFGLIETGYLSVMHNSIADPEQGVIYDDSFIPGLAKIATAVHEADPEAKVFAQIVHTGNLAHTPSTGEIAVGASSIAASYLNEPVHELSTSEAWDVIAAFADAAERAQKAGFDGVEVHGAHGYLINQFLSARTNKRTDEFGGSIADRARFACEVVKAVKERCGSSFPVSFRFSAEDDVEGGNTLSDTAAQMQLVADAGADLLNVSIGTCESGTIIQPNYSKPGFNAFRAARIRANVKVPVCVVGRINDPALASSIVAGGEADLVGLGRQSLADPAFPNKVRDGRLNEIVACTGCMQRCIGMPTCGPDDSGVSCMLNPFAGKESLPAWQIEPAAKPKKVTVVGAGVIGLAAARVAAQRGHEVTVLEKASVPGGQYRLASMPPDKSDLAKTISSFETLALKAGATIQYNTEATAESIAALSPDTVLLSTGATPLWPRIPGIEGANVVKANDVLSGKVVLPASARVLVVGAGLVGCETAEFLSVRGNALTIVDMVPAMAAAINRHVRAALLERFDKHGVSFIPNAKVLEFTSRGARIQPVERDEAGTPYDNGDPVELSGFDYVVVAMGARAYNPLEEELNGKVPELTVIGDAQRARDAKAGIYEAVKAALAL